MNLEYISLCRNILSTIFLILFITSCQSYKSLPEGISFLGEPRSAENILFLKDLTYLDKSGERKVDQEIFPEIFRVIKESQRLIILDMFLYNDFQGSIREETRPLSEELTDLLIKQKKKYPIIKIFVITDPINTVYGGLQSSQFARLRNAGISVTISELNSLRDSNVLYSAFWRLFFKPFGNSQGGLLNNPFGKGKVTLRSYLRLLNFKANHRKVIIADSKSNFVGIITSANPHDGSSAHGNIAVKFSGEAVCDLLETEKAVLAFSNGPKVEKFIPCESQSDNTTIQILTEGKIRDAVLKSINLSEKGDVLDLAMFYLSDRSVIKALKNAHYRGVTLRLLLDPNKDAFGHKKNGIPNRQVANELNKLGIQIRWCSTHGEQCHAKMLHIRYRNGYSSLILGSANFTRRNLNDLNLETDVFVKGLSKVEIFKDAMGYFDIVWNNTPNMKFSDPYQVYGEKSFLKQIFYRIMEVTGFSTF